MTGLGGGFFFERPVVPTIALPGVVLLHPAIGGGRGTPRIDGAVRVGVDAGGDGRLGVPSALGLLLFEAVLLAPGDELLLRALLLRGGCGAAAAAARASSAASKKPSRSRLPLRAREHSSRRRARDACWRCPRGGGRGVARSRGGGGRERTTGPGPREQRAPRVGSPSSHVREGF